MSDTPRYATLRDYLRVVRANRLVLLLAVLLFAGAGYAIAVRQTPVYVGEATVSFLPQNSDQALLDTNADPAPAQDVRPIVSAQLLRKITLAERVRRRLRTTMTLGQLQGAVSGRVDPTTNLLRISGRADGGAQAAAIANAFADEVADTATNDQRRRYGQAASILRLRLARLDPKDQDARFTRTTLLARIAQLDALRNFARVAQVLRRSELPSTPVSPRPLRSALLGLLVGLAIGLLIAFVRDALDQRLRGSRDIEEYLHLPVLGHVDETALGRTPVEPFNGVKALTQPDIEAFRILRTNLDFLQVDRRLTTVAVTSGLAEEGKTSVAVALASLNAVAGRTTLLIECDLRRPSLTGRLGIARAPGLTDYLAGRATPAEILQKVPLSTDLFGDLATGVAANGRASPGDSGDESGPSQPSALPHSFVCIGAGSQVPLPAEVLGSERFGALLRDVSEVYDLVVLDTAPLLSVVDTREFLHLIDGILLCVRSHRTTEGEARAAKEALDRVPERPTGLVVTGLRAGDETDFAYYSYAYQYGSK